MAYPWPGNVRQLRHVLRTALALADGRPIERAHLTALPLSPVPLAVLASNAIENHTASRAGHCDTNTADASSGETVPRDEAVSGKLKPLQAHERAMLLQLIVEHRWNVSNVAKAIGVSRNALYRKLHKLDIEVSHPVKVSN